MAFLFDGRSNMELWTSRSELFFRSDGPDRFRVLPTAYAGGLHSYAASRLNSKFQGSLPAPSSCRWPSSFRPLRVHLLLNGSHFLAGSVGAISRRLFGEEHFELAYCL